MSLLAVVLLMGSCKEDDSNQPVRPDNRETSEKSPLVEVLTRKIDDPGLYLEFAGGEPLERRVEQALPGMGGNLVRALVKTIASHHIPKMDSLFAKEVGTGENGERRWKMESYVYTYKSVAADGQDILLSARITFPNNTLDRIDHEVQTLALNIHAYLWNDWVPFECPLLAPLRCYRNAAVIDPDFQGFGIDEGKHIHCGLSANTLARQLADATTAGLELMRSRGVQLAEDGHSNVWACSLGSPVPIAFAKYVETEAPKQFRDAVKLGSVFCGGGPIDFVLMNKNFDQSRVLKPGVYKILFRFINCLSTEQLGGYKPTDFAADYFNDVRITIDGKEYTYFEANALELIENNEHYEGVPVIESYREVFAPDMLTPEGRLDMDSPKTKALVKMLAEQDNILYGWRPTIPIYMSHYQKDDYIPYDQAKEAYEILSENGKNPAVHWHDMRFSDALIRITGEGTHQASCAILLLGCASVEEPEDMYRLWRSRTQTASTARPRPTSR
jgi:hypothetical protein